MRKVLFYHHLLSVIRHFEHSRLAFLCDFFALVLGLIFIGSTPLPPYTLSLSNSWSQDQLIVASDPVAGDNFGSVVAVDGNFAVVGAYNFDIDGGKTNAGAAYVYQKNNGVWSQVAKLTASDGIANDNFGIDVDIDDDTIVIGARGGTNPGSAYVFVRPESGWVTTSAYTGKLVSYDGAGSDKFGIDVEVDNDVIAVGAFRDDDAGSDSGSLYIFNKPESGWAVMQARLMFILSQRKGGLPQRQFIRLN